MRLIFKLLAMGSVGLGLAGYGVYLYTGKLPWEFFDGLPAMPKMEAPSLPKLGDILPKVELAGQDQLYKWRDARGEWHYTSEPPGEGVKFELLTIDRNTNVMPGPGTEKQTATGEEDKSASDYFAEVMEKASSIKQQQKDRAAESQEVMDNP